MTFIKLEAEHGSALVDPAQIAHISYGTRKSRFQYRVCLVNGDCLYLNKANFNLLLLELGL